MCDITRKLQDAFLIRRHGSKCLSRGEDKSLLQTADRQRTRDLGNELKEKLSWEEKVGHLKNEYDIEISPFEEHYLIPTVATAICAFLFAILVAMVLYMNGVFAGNDPPFTPPQVTPTFKDVASADRTVPKTISDELPSSHLPLHFVFTGSSSKAPEAPARLTNPVNISTVPLFPSTEKADVRQCPIGSTSYESFGLDNPPFVIPKCFEMSDHYTNGKRINGYELSRVKCDDCQYFAMEIAGFKTSSISTFKSKLLKPRTMIINGTKFCTGPLSFDQIKNLTLPNLEWLRIELEESNECLPLFEFLSTWDMPNLKLLSLRKVFFSPSNKVYISGILKKSSGLLSSLHMSQMVAATSDNANPFQGVSFPELTEADLGWSVKPTAKASEVVGHIENFIAAAPNLRKVTIPVYIPFTKLAEISRMMPKLVNGLFSVTLEDNGQKGWNILNLYKLAFENIQTLLLTVSLIPQSDQTPPPPVVVTGFKNIKSTLECLTVMTKEIRPIEVEGQAEQDCSKKYIFVHEHQISCCRIIVTKDQ